MKAVSLEKAVLDGEKTCLEKRLVEVQTTLEKVDGRLQEIETSRQEYDENILEAEQVRKCVQLMHKIVITAS